MPASLACMLPHVIHPVISPTAHVHPGCQSRKEEAGAVVQLFPYKCHEDYDIIVYLDYFKMKEKNLRRISHARTHSHGTRPFTQTHTPSRSRTCFTEYSGSEHNHPPNLLLQHAINPSIFIVSPNYAIGTAFYIVIRMYRQNGKTSFLPNTNLTSKSTQTPQFAGFGSVQVSEPNARPLIIT